MSHQVLSKFCDVLTAEERASLSLAAAAHGDEVELERLMTTAPRRSVWEMHHTGVTRALCICGCIHRAEQLEVIAGYFFSTVRVHQAVNDDDCETGTWLPKMAQLFSYRFILNREAWRLFCDGIGVCGEHVVDGAPGDWIVDLADINIPSIAPRDEEMAELMRDVLGHEVEASGVVTAEKEMRDWQALYRGLSGR